MTYNITFQDRAKSSADAKKKALEKLKAKTAAKPAKPKGERTED